MSNVTTLKPAADPPCLTEDAAAIEFARRYADRLRYDHDIGAWYEFDGVVWRRDRTRRAYHFAREEVRRLGQSERVRRQTSNAAFANGVERFSQRDPVLAVTSDFWDRDIMLLGTPSGTVDLRTGELRVSRASDAITKMTACAPSAVADCPLWKRFLAETFGGDDELVCFLQRFLGYCLTGFVNEHTFVFAHGAGGNGKGIFVGTISGIMADYAAVAPMDAFVSSSFDRPSADLAMLAGARLVTASETEEGRYWAEARIKSITGGDTITARYMRQNFFSYTPQFKLVVVGNHQPRLANVDDAIKRRLRMVPFLHRAEVPDTQLAEKLRAEWPGILRWMLEGCLEWQTHGLGSPTSIRDANSSYFAEQDVFAQWLADCCDLCPGSEMKTARSADLFASWKRYAEASGEKPRSKIWLAGKLHKANATNSRSTGGVAIWKGIELRRDGSGRGVTQ